MFDSQRVSHTVYAHSHYCFIGLNNNFLINTRHEYAILYNDKSVLENYHASFGSKLLLDETYNILEGLTREQYRDFRRHYTQIILATDMANHFTICSKFETRITTSPLSKDNPDDKCQLLRMIMKCADISNITRPFAIAKKWAKLCIEEFFSQGDKEKQVGLPISPLMDRKTVNFPKSQIDFSDFVAAPLFKNVVSAFPHMTYIIATIRENRAQWKLLLAEQEKVKSQEAIANPSPEKREQQVIGPKKEITPVQQLSPPSCTEIGPVESQEVDTTTPLSNSLLSMTMPKAQHVAVESLNDTSIRVNLVVLVMVLAIVVYAVLRLWA